jgi:predicted nucleotidyltransferase
LYQEVSKSTYERKRGSNGSTRAFEVFAQAAEEKQGDRIHEIILYGSVARGEATEQSDVDVLIVLAENEQPEKLSGEPRTLSALAFDIGLKYDAVITPYIKTKESSNLGRITRFCKMYFGRDGRFNEDT